MIGTLTLPTPSVSLAAARQKAAEALLKEGGKEVVDFQAKRAAMRRSGVIAVATAKPPGCTGHGSPNIGRVRKKKFK